jgi:hypothetical protein
MAGIAGMTQAGGQRCLKNSRQASLTAENALADVGGHLDERAHPVAGEAVSV